MSATPDSIPTIPSVIFALFLIVVFLRMTAGERRLKRQLRRQRRGN